jgi:hypothetical protein
MTRRRPSQVVPIPLTVGQDPSLWRYSSVQEALATNITIIAEMIRAGEEACRAAELQEEAEEAEEAAR